MTRAFTWHEIERTTWVASVPGGLLFRYYSRHSFSPNSSIVFVPCLVQEDVIKGLVDAYKSGLSNA